MSWSRQVPIDLVVTGAASVVAIATVAVLGASGGALSGVAGLLLVLFLPGYALLAALFPSFEAVDAAWAGTETGIDPVERLAFAVPLSIAVSCAVGVVFLLTPIGLQRLPLAVALGGITLGGAVAGAYRRQYHHGHADATEIAPTESTRSDESLSRTLQFALAVLVVVATGAIAYPLAAPTHGEAYTKVSLLTEQPDGTLGSSGYPTNLTAGESGELVLSVHNSRSEAVEYTVVVLLQNVSGTAEVRSQTRLHTFSQRVSRGETWRVSHSIEPTMTGELRLQYLVYAGAPPATPTVATADREAHLWLNVTA